MSDEACVRLVVFMETADRDRVESDNHKFCCNPDPQAAQIEAFCRGTGHFVYSRTFVSIAVVGPNENICESVALMYGDADDDDDVFQKPQCAVLKPEVICNIDMVGRDDLRQLLTEMANRWGRNHSVESHLGRARNLRPLSAAEKWEALLWATMERGSHGYSEARLNRCITSDDVDHWEECD